MKYKVKIPNGHVIRRSKGSYDQDLKRLHKFVPCTIVQETNIPDDEDVNTTIIKLDPPANSKKRTRKFRLRAILYVAAVALLTSCTQSPSNAIPIADLETGRYCENTPLTPSNPDTTIDIFAEWEKVSRLGHAFAVVESNDNPNAYNPKENAVGLLQIRPCMVAEANRIIGEELYTLSDRWDSVTSLCIFNTVMSELNPELDVDRAIDIWNPNATQSYRNLIKSLSNL